VRKEISGTEWLFAGMRKLSGTRRKKVKERCQLCVRMSNIYCKTSPKTIKTDNYITG
jgi:hypothetical protein